MDEKAEFKKERTRNYYKKKAAEKYRIRKKYKQKKAIQNNIVTEKIKVREKKKKQTKIIVQEYMKLAYYYDIIYRIVNNLVHRATNRLKKLKIERYLFHLELIGCSYEALRIHLEKQFTEGMSFDNYGLDGWVVDHIKPIDSFDLRKEDQLKECFNYKNLQPLWKLENLEKGAKLDWKRKS